MAFTPQQLRIHELLNDGEFHTRREIHELLDDDLAGNTAISAAICNLRKKLNPGLIIEACVRNPGSNRGYRMMRHISTDDTNTG